jgi:protein SCO1/2
MKAVRIVLIVLAAVMAGLFFWLWNQVNTEATALSNEPWGVPFSLTRQDGAPITEQAFRGKPTALFFGFTNCPEICPTTVYELSGWMNKVDPGKDKLQAYFVSIDPDRDTPAALKTYLTNVTDRIVGISGDPEKVKEMARGFKVYFKKVPTDPNQPNGEYTMDHTASVFLLDRQGRFSGTITYGENPDVAEKKLENLIAKN